ncbi:hypothetical protein F511_19323 [Dorcoceras hygrometricum]|uniref:Uncharacterized protein n=1 Tax=Dorcoceras hygrometricum TaxID=472368 RepID=A0A2Z7BIY2_9LAMI|nr:hypothetical protein F511_19323 [Dorcoceras hygrometricum]
MVSMKNPLAAILDSNRFTGLNYQDWLHNLNLVLASEKLLYAMEKSPLKEAPADISPEELITLKQLWDDEVKARCYVMASMSNEMQRRFEKKKYAADQGQQPKATTKEGSQRTQCTAQRKSATEYVATIAVDNRQSGPRPEPRLLRQPALEALTNSARTDSPRKAHRGGVRIGDGFGSGPTGPGPTDEHLFHLHHRDFTVTPIADQIGPIDSVSETEYYDLKNHFSEPQCKMTVLPLNNGKPRDTASRGPPQPLWLRNHNPGLAQRIMVKRLATSPHDPLGITDSACKNQSVMVSVQYGPFNPYIPIRSTTIGKSRVAIDPIAMHTSWRSESQSRTCPTDHGKASSNIAP